MPSSNWDFDYPQSDYTTGWYRISLAKPANWYEKHLLPKGDKTIKSQIEDIIPSLINGLFGHECHLDEISKLMYQDWIVDSKTEDVTNRLRTHLLAEVLRFFPKLGAYVPEHMYYVKGKELFIHVPNSYEEQRGIFF